MEFANNRLDLKYRSNEYKFERQGFECGDDVPSEFGSYLRFHTPAKRKIKISKKKNKEIRFRVKRRGIKH